MLSAARAGTVHSACLDEMHSRVQLLRAECYSIVAAEARWAKTDANHAEKT